MGREWQLDRRIALTAVALLTISFWHLIFSRLGFRAITQPLLQALTIAALFRGLRKGQWGWLALAGIFLGLTAYTYLAARVFPLLLLLGLLPLLNGRTRLSQLALFALIGLLTLTPLLNYFIAHPDAFWVRITQVSPGSANISALDGFLKSLGMLFLIGDPYWRFNWPDRSLFGWFWGGLLLVGWVISLLRTRQVPYDWQKSALLLIVFTPFIMILPTALATNEILPSNLRAIGLIPIIFYLPAVGLMTLLQAIEDHAARFPVTRIWWMVIVGVLLLGSNATNYLYFGRWAAQPELFYESDGDLTAVAQFLDQPQWDDYTLYVAALHYQHPTLAFLSERYEQIKWLPQSQVLVFPDEGPALYIYPHSSPRPEWTDRYLPTQVDSDDYLGPDGEPLFTAYTLTDPLRPPAPMATDVNFSNTINLRGYQLETADTINLTLFWQVVNVPPVALVPFVHLEDEWQHRWSQIEPNAYPAAQWQTGETIIQRVEMPVPAGMPSGQYRLRVGLFDPTTGKPLAQFDEIGRYAGDAFVIDGVNVTAVSSLPSNPQPQFILDEHVRTGLRLLGYERSSVKVSTGEPLNLALWWQATESQPRLTTRLELLRPDRTGLILINTQPVHGTYPFQNWATPQFLIDRLSPSVPENIPSGDYKLYLRLLDAQDETLLTADLGSITVEQTQRTFSRPHWTVPAAATFGNEITLAGYDLNPLENGQATLTLYWYAETVPAADYTVFVHILDPNGVCCVWQQDVMPQQNQHPTSRWLAGEYVADTYLITPDSPLEPGRYPTEIGLYIAETGRRLQAVVPGQDTRDAV
jgi:hypothetical protein